MRIAATVFLLGLAAAGMPNPATAQNVTRDAAACGALSSLTIPGLPLSITKAEWIAAGAPVPGPPNVAPPTVPLPAYCRLDGVLDKRTGADGKSYGIGFAMGLPADWN